MARFRMSGLKVAETRSAGPDGSLHLLGTLSELFRAPWRARNERLQAAACCREVLRLDRMVAKGQAWLSREARYLKVIAAQVDCDAAEARALLESARTSFASWPVRRELTLRDVAHTLAVSAILSSRDSDGWISASLKHVVNSAIPPGA